MHQKNTTDNLSKGEIIIKVNRIAIRNLGLMASALPLFVYFIDIKWIGFPDGYLTGLESVEKIFPSFYWIKHNIWNYLFIFCMEKLIEK